MSTPETKPKGMELEVAVGGEGATSGTFERGADASKPDLKVVEAEGQGVEFNKDGTVTETGLRGTSDDAPKEEQSESSEDALKEEESGEAPATPEDLGDYDPANSSKFDERYFSDAGGDEGPTLNLAAFNAELAANLAADPENFDINKNTRGWLKDRLGISDQLINNHLAGLKAQQQVGQEAFYAHPDVGGKDAYEAKLAWGKENYTPDQKAKFNAALKAGGDAALEAVELLSARFTKAGGKSASPVEKTVSKVPSRPERRAASPSKDVTAAASAPSSQGVEPFASEADHRAALKASKSDKERDAIRARLRVSPWWTGQK